MPGDGSWSTSASPTWRTPWGLAGETVYELYRDWPWSGMRVAMTMACLHRPRESLFWLLDSIKYAAANGALPEKTRLDGCAIHYWYSSTHGLLVSAVVFALAYADADDTLHLFWGLDGQWLDLEFDGLCLHGGLKVSAQVKQRRLQCLRIENATMAARTVRVCINPAYEAPDIPAQSLAPLAAAEIDVESDGS